MKCNSKSGCGQHRQVICAVTHSYSLCYVYMLHLCQQPKQLGLASSVDNLSYMSFMERVALLKGLDESVMREIAENLPVTEGVGRMMEVLKRAGFKTAILSGGFTYFGNYLKQKFGIDYVYANELEIIDGKLTGRYVGEIVNGRRKAELLRLLNR